MTDESTTPPERSWSGETGWPAQEPTPSWAEPTDGEESSDEREYDAWLDAQAPSGDEPEEPEATPTPGPREEPVQDRSEAVAIADTEVDEPVDEPVEQDEPETLEDALVHDSAVEAPPAAEEAEQPGVPATRSATPVIASLAVLAVLLAALTALLGVTSVGTRGGGDVGDARRDALAAARTATRLVFSYDYRHLDKDFAAGKAVTTGKFASDYERTTSKLVDEVAGKYKAVVVADVSDAAVVRASKDRVVTLVFLNQRSTSSLAAGQKITQSRITMVLVRRNGTWLVSEVNAF